MQSLSSLAVGAKVPSTAAASKYWWSSTHQYLLAAADAGAFTAMLNELGLRVQHFDGTVEGRPPVPFAEEQGAVPDYLADNSDHPHIRGQGSEGVAVKQSRGGVDASHQKIAAANIVVVQLAVANP